VENQVCLAIKRIYVHESIYGPFREAVVRHVAKLQVGNGLDPATTMGPVQNAMQYERVQRLFQDLETQKWNVAFGGGTLPHGAPKGGYFITPTIIDNPAETSSIVQEEPFGE
jgi:acyl-CoA reductase-like NAD-dependent aldehyde dehydrogenase